MLAAMGGATLLELGAGWVPRATVRILGGVRSPRTALHGTSATSLVGFQGHQP